MAVLATDAKPVGQYRSCVYNTRPARWHFVNALAVPSAAAIMANAAKLLVTRPMRSSGRS